MEDYEKILKLIETVKPDDTDALDEIDRLTEEFLGFPIRSYVSEWNNCTYWEKQDVLCGEKRWTESIRRFTTSRDALKAIRPEGWHITCITNCTGDINSWFYCTMVKHECPDATHIKSGFPTEELSELNAVIQAIEWERNNS